MDEVVALIQALQARTSQHLNLQAWKGNSIIFYRITTFDDENGDEYDLLGIGYTDLDHLCKYLKAINNFLLFSEATNGL